MKTISKIIIAFLLTTNLFLSDLKANAEQHLSQYNISMQVARDFIMNNYQGDLELVYTTAKTYSVNNDMLAEILANDFPGLTGETVSAFFDAYGFNGNSLGFNDMLYHNGYLYETLTSPISGRVWIDRNIGASEVCTQNRSESNSDLDYISEQKSCFGDIFQWGRLADGHEKLDSTSIDTRAIDISDAGVNFILSSSPADWVENTSQDSNNVDDNGSLRTTQWSKIDGTSICPIGFRVPTLDELSSDTISYEETTNEDIGAVKVIDASTAFKNFLKLPLSGWRSTVDGVVYSAGNIGLLWSSNAEDENASSLKFSDPNTKAEVYSRGLGLGVRCIDDNTTPTANAGENQTVAENTEVIFNASGSSDDGLITSFVWNQGDTILSNEISFSKSDFEIGIHTITLTVTDDKGAKSTDTVVVTVSSLVVIDPDVNAPELSHSNETYVTTVGFPLVLQTVTATDNVDGSVPVTQGGTTPDFNTVGTYNVTYSASDSSSNISTIIHTYVVNDVVVGNTAPIATSINLEKGVEETVIHNLNENISDVEDPDNSLIITVVSAPSKGSLSWNGNEFTYEVSDDVFFFRNDSFTYFVTDINGATSSIETVNIANIWVI